jgi:hypothetical protein
MAERVEGLSQLERDSTQSKPVQRKRHYEKPPNLVLIAALVIAAIMTLFGLIGLRRYQVLVLGDIKERGSKLPPSARPLGRRTPGR